MLADLSEQIRENPRLLTFCFAGQLQINLLLTGLGKEMSINV